jgi:hypothetical protein
MAKLWSSFAMPALGETPLAQAWQNLATLAQLAI